MAEAEAARKEERKEILPGKVEGLFMFWGLRLITAGLQRSGVSPKMEERRSLINLWRMHARADRSRGHVTRGTGVFIQGRGRKSGRKQRQLGSGDG